VILTGLPESGLIGVNITEDACVSTHLTFPFNDKQELVLAGAMVAK